MPIVDGEEPPAKRARASPALGTSTDVTDDDVMSFENWMMSWRQGTEEADGRRTLLPGMSQAEVTQLKVQAAREEEQRRRDVDDATASLQSEFATLISVTEVGVAKARAKLVHLESLHNAVADDDILRLADELLESNSDVQRKIASCREYIRGAKFQILKSGRVDPDVRQEAASLEKRVEQAAHALQETICGMERRREAAVCSCEQEAKRLKAIEDAEMMQSLFTRYDRDKDGKLNVHEVRLFAREECNYEVASEKVVQLLGSQYFGGTVSRETFPRLRLLIGVESVSGALEGVEAELAKAEEKARPLSARGPAAVPLWQLPDLLSQLELAVDVVKDYLDAAREQVAGLTSSEGGSEAAALSIRLERLETRLSQAQAVVKHCNDRIELQRKKAELMSQLR